MEKIYGKTDNRPLKDRINFNTVVALCFLLFSIIFYLLIPYQIAEPKLFMGRHLSDMKPTLFPRVAFAGLTFLSVLYLILSFRLKEENLFKAIEGKRYIKIVVSFLVFLCYALVFESLGFLISSMLLIGILVPYYGYRKIPVYIPVLIGIPLALYLIFVRVLHVSLPDGILF